ncbi:unnamed protein product [Gongylonema pulchrum]|uniref:DRIM domain-containing protein n=1 Tax=Gongylonema pulchrum TaxID=637853 RepID=A0A183DQS1_9BILA|nr:unnamed protein product [Gongylonema pulchrum]
MFGHWSSRVRQTALTVLCHFDVPLNSAGTDGGHLEKVENAFSILLKAEKTPLTLVHYRTRLMLLRRLSYGSHIKHMPRDCDAVLETIPLRIIIASLYERFTILWSQLLDIIETYAYGLNITTFFTLFSSFVKTADAEIASENNNKIPVGLCRITGFNEENTPDYGMFRLQNEYQKGKLFEKRENILAVSSETVERGTDKDDDEAKVVTDDHLDTKCMNKNGKELLADEGTKNSVSSGELNIDGPCIGRKMVRRTVIALLEVGNFENLVDEKLFLNELICFTVDDQNSVIDEKHRSDLMPILLRLLYGKYNMHVHKGEVARRAAILRFLASCNPEEIDIFLKLLFAPLLHLTGRWYHWSQDSPNYLKFCHNGERGPNKIAGEEESLEVLCSRIVATFDLSSVIPLSTIKGQHIWERLSDITNLGYPP